MYEDELGLESSLWKALRLSGEQNQRFKLQKSFAGQNSLNLSQRAQ